MILTMTCRECKRELPLREFREPGIEKGALLHAECYDCRGVSKRQRSPSRLRHDKIRGRAETYKRYEEGSRQWVFWKALQQDPCAYCGVRPCGTTDHITPVGEGGKGTFDNLTGCCPDCNVAKDTSTLLEFLLRRRMV